MGVAVTDGSTLVGWGVHRLRNGERPHDVISQARKIILSYLAEHRPAVVAIEKPLMLPTKRAALMSVITDELHVRSRGLWLRVVQVDVRDARRIVAGNPHATKLDVARVIAGLPGFAVLREKLPKAPPHPALGYRGADKYWLHIFDALAVALSIDLAA